MRKGGCRILEGGQGCQLFGRGGGLLTLKERVGVVNVLGGGCQALGRDGGLLDS